MEAIFIPMLIGGYWLVTAAIATSLFYSAMLKVYG